MRTIGPNEASLRIVDASAGAGRAQSLKAGAVVSVQVRELVGPDAAHVGTDASRASSEAQLYRVVIGSRLLVASSSSSLPLGSILRARVESSGSTLLLKILAPSSEAPEAKAARLPSASASALISAAGLPSDTAAFSALAALLREGISPEPRALARVRRAALGENADATELAARMEAKGIPADRGALEGLIEACTGELPGGGHDSSGNGGSGNGGSEDGGAGRRGEGDNSPAEAESATLEAGALWLDFERDFEREIPEPELGRALAAMLRGLALRANGDGASAGADDTVRDARSGGGGGTLALFNHLRGPEGSWVIVPFRFGLDAIDFAGSYRIQLPYARGGAGRLEAVFSASRGVGREDWAATLSFGGGRATALRIVAPKGRESDLGGPLERAGLERLAADLAALSCSVRVGSGSAALCTTDARGEAGLDLDA